MQKKNILNPRALKAPSKKKTNKHGFATRAIHTGSPPDTATGAVIPPLVLSSTYVQSSPGVHKGYDYSRAGNPTRAGLEKCMASLEEGKFCQATASGVAAEYLVFEFLKPGDTLVSEQDLYGGTLRIFEKILKPKGIHIKLLDLSQTKNLKTIPSHTRMIWLESPTNPEMKLMDIQKIAVFAKKKNILLAVDNTFMTPFFQKPLSLGADIVVHSATKYLGGHSDIVGGAIVTRRKDLADLLAFWSKSLGPVLSPFDSWLLLRSLKTLNIRMKKHEENAGKMAHFLEKHPRVKKTLYPGLKSHPQYQLARRQMSGNGGMISIHLKGGKKSIFQCLKRFRIFKLAESLGGVESLVEHPATMTHLSSPYPPPLSLVRISCGLEDIQDLKQDMQNALGPLS